MRRDGRLTPGQRRTLAALVAYVEAHGYAPSQRELRDLLGLASLRSVQRYLARLHDAGALVYTPGVPRGVALTLGAWPLQDEEAVK